MTAAAPSLELRAEAQRAAYAMVDRYLRNNLMDDDYAEYSQALELIYEAAPRAALQADPVAVFPSERELAPWLRKAVGDMFGECDGVLTEETVIECVQDTLAYLRNTAPPTDALPADRDDLVQLFAEELTTLQLRVGSTYTVPVSDAINLLKELLAKPTDEAPPKPCDACGGAGYTMRPSGQHACWKCTP